MSKLSVIERNRKRIQKSYKAQESRLKLKKMFKKGTPEDQEAAQLKLQKNSRDESRVRIRHRCHKCGRPCGTLKKFGLCRIHLREAVMRGDVPGLRKASW
ncbi:30S ribosomal protein S14 [Coxiella endosymbiont of Amblyomma americanum]|uniref:30S ribosomal protein S14 n=1 Tax=Coxiella endosymbiont of Amblyomma americanum TaxID=325775 RepID=UPI00057F42B1|nr:30S ribosomal protein S14 [Coxiella endosymbiont of Amblyomma americanum]AJC50436.1 30S ribosomal protein S14 [Coxiella endosymbiont of Amblyomma americanum]AUJ58776.1 30S ribosomal protein S14 [Coxiella-like endosymbiont of Amblyomma americanum]